MQKQLEKKVNGHPSKEITLSPSEYGLLHKLAINRPVSGVGVNIMRESVIRNGILRRVILTWDSKKSRYYIVDGQHLVEALKQLESDIPCLVVSVENEAQLVQLMIDLNNISRTWKLVDYINGWRESGNKDYRLLMNAKDVMYPDVQLSVIIQAYAQTTRGKATKMVKEGTFKITNRDESERIIDSVSSCLGYLPNTRPINESLVKLMLTTEDYNQKKMITNLKDAVKRNVNFVLKGETETYKLLEKIYKK
jgi:hypothetical protein